MSNKVEVQKLSKDLGLNLFVTDWLPVPDQDGTIMCFKEVGIEHPQPRKIVFKGRELTIGGRYQHFLSPSLYQYSSEGFKKIGPDLPMVGEISKFLYQLNDLDCISPPLAPKKILSVNKDTFILSNNYTVFSVSGGQKEIILDVSDQAIFGFDPCPVHQFGDLFISNRSLDMRRNKNKVATVRHDGRISKTQEISVLNKANISVRITALHPLPNGDLLVGGYDGSLLQIRLDDAGNLVKNTFIKYLHNFGGQPEPIRFISHLPNSNNYLIGGGTLFLAQFQNGKIVVVDEVNEWSTYYDGDRIIGNPIVDICPLSGNLAMVFTQVCHDGVCHPKSIGGSVFDKIANIVEDEKDKFDKPKSIYYPCYVEIKERQVILRELPLFTSCDEDKPTGITQHLLLPSNHLLFGGTDNNLFLAWAEDDVFKYQKINFPGPDYKRQTCNLKIDYWEYSEKYTEVLKGAARIKYKFFVGGLVLVKRRKNSCQVLVQRNFVHDKDNIKKTNSDAYIDADKKLSLKPADSFLLTIKTN